MAARAKFRSAHSRRVRLPCSAFRRPSRDVSIRALAKSAAPVLCPSPAAARVSIRALAKSAEITLIYQLRFIYFYIRSLAKSAA